MRKQIGRKKQTKISKVRRIKSDNIVIRASFCVCNCMRCGFDNHCGGAGCYHKIFDV